MKSTHALQKLTRKIRRIAATPDVAMTLALLGTRLSSVGMMASAPWSNLFPSSEDTCLRGQKQLIRGPLDYCYRLKCIRQDIWLTVKHEVCSHIHHQVAF